jgi:zinc-ribbon domain
MQCWQCGADVQPGQRTCDNCGARLTSPPDGRPQRPSQQRYSSPRNAPRRRRDDGWQDDGDYGSDSEPSYGAAHRPPDDRRSERPRSRSRGEDDRDDSQGDPRHDWRGQSRDRTRARPEPDDSGAYDQQGDFGSSYADGAGDGGGAGYDPRPPDPFDDPRAPRNMRPSPQRGPDSRGGYAQESRGRRPPTDPSRDEWRDQGYSQGQQDYYDDDYGRQGRPRRSQPSSADNRYGGSRSRSQYDERYGDDSYGGRSYGGYDEGYSEEQQAQRRGYGRQMPPDDQSSWYQQVGSRARSLQQRWENTLGSVRIPGVRPHDGAGEDKGGTSTRRLVTTIVLLLVVFAAVAGGVIYLAPRLLNRTGPTAGTSSSLCTPKGAATDNALPTPGANSKQFTSTRSHYGVNYPETWTVEQQQKAAGGYDYIDVFTLPNTTTSVNVEQPEAACALTDTNIIQGEVAQAQQQNVTFTEDTAAATTQVISGETWQRREYDVASQGVKLHMVILACHHQGRAYIIVLVSGTTTFKRDSTGIFEPMLKSFAFLK